MANYLRDSTRPLTRPEALADLIRGGLSPADAEALLAYIWVNSYRRDGDLAVARDHNNFIIHRYKGGGAMTHDAEAEAMENERLEADTPEVAVSVKDLNVYRVTALVGPDSDQRRVTAQVVSQDRDNALLAAGIRLERGSLTPMLDGHVQLAKVEIGRKGEWVEV